MAKTKAPLLSLGASGKFADTIVTMRWKGLKTAREYVVPANPQTAAQTTGRTAIQAAVYAYRNYFTDQEMRDAWNLSARLDKRPLSGYNLFLSCAKQLYEIDPQKVMAVASDEGGSRSINFDLIAIEDGGSVVEAGYAQFYASQDARGLVYVGEKEVTNDWITSPSLGEVGETWYCMMVKDGIPRSGIVRDVLVA